MSAEKSANSATNSNIVIAVHLTKDIPREFVERNLQDPRKVRVGVEQADDLLRSRSLAEGMHSRRVVTA